MKLLAALLLCLLPLIATAQEGTVVYEETIKLDIKLPPEMEHMRDRFPTMQTNNKLLLFNEAASLMKAAPKTEEDESAGDDRVQIRFGGRDADDALYTNADDDVTIEKRDFMGRTFLIKGTPATLAWKLTGEQSEFLGYLCQKATAMRDTVAVEAWFTPQIPASVGPAQYHGLPGLILVLTEDDGRRSYVAKSISLDPLAADAIAPPDKGRDVTRAEFDEIVAEKMKEMGANRRGGMMIFRQE